MRVMECNLCGETLTAATDRELERQLRAHTEAQHPQAGYDEDKLRETVASDAYEASDS